MVMPIYPRFTARWAKGRVYSYSEYKITTKDATARAILLTRDEAETLIKTLYYAIEAIEKEAHKMKKIFGEDTPITEEEKEQIKLAKEIISILKNYDEIRDKKLRKQLGIELEDE